jgi:hypothetical protein
MNFQVIYDDYRVIVQARSYAELRDKASSKIGEQIVIFYSREEDAGIEDEDSFCEIFSKKKYSHRNYIEISAFCQKDFDDLEQNSDAYNQYDEDYDRHGK